MPVKVFVHFEPQAPSSYSALTFGVTVADDTSISSVLQEFVLRYNKKFGDALKASGADHSHFSLVDGEGKGVCGGSRPAEARLVLFVADGDDIFVVRSSTTPPPLEPLKGRSESVKTTTTALPTLPKAAAAKAPQQTHSAVPKLKDRIKNKQYRQARIELDDLLKTEKSSNASLLILKAELVYLSSSDYDRSVDLAYKAVGLVASNPHYKLVLAQALRRAERLDESLAQLDDAITAQGAKAQGAGLSLYLDLVALKAEVLFDMGRDMQAAAEVNKTVSLNEAEGHRPTLAAYARFAVKYDRTEEAVRALLKAIVLEQSSKPVKAMLAKVVSTPSGFDELLRQLPAAEKSAAAYAFLASICKDCSCVAAAIKLYTLSVGLNRDSANYALNLAHTQELSLDYRSAVGSLVGFLRANPARRAGARGYSCAELLAALPADVTDGADTFRYERKDVGARAAPSVSLFIQWVDEKAGGSGERSYGLVSPVGGGSPLVSSEELFASSEALTDEAQDLLAVAFTLVKVLYLAGRLAELPAIFAVVEPARCSSAVPLHTTTVRNEHAYYVCVGQVLSARYEMAGEAALVNPLFCQGSSGAASGVAANPIYVVGDSHVLSAAWSVVTVGGERRRLEPRLVTGVKHWHLRKESVFYPKYNFSAAVASLPPGADVLFVLGEIDCREGLLLAVERDVYEGVPAGVAATVDIFATTLKRLLAAPSKLSVFVHPVLPILDETRPLVDLYNVAYKRAVLGLGSPRCRWLDFAGEVCGGGAVLAQYALDGTHIHPRYVQELLEPALGR